MSLKSLAATFGLATAATLSGCAVGITPRGDVYATPAPVYVAPAYSAPIYVAPPVYVRPYIGYRSYGRGRHHH